MSVTKDQKGLYWQTGESMDLKFREMCIANNYNGATEYLVGKKTFVHFLKTPEGRFSVQQCAGRDCQYCRDAKPTMRLETVADFEGREYFVEIGVTVSREIGKVQNMMKSMGKSDEEVMNTVFNVTKLNGRPFWAVSVAPGGGATAAPAAAAPKQATFGPAKAAAPTQAPAKLDQASMDAALAAAQPSANGLNANDVAFIKSIEPSLKAQLERNPAYNISIGVQAVLKQAGWSADKQAAAIKLFDAAGNVVEA